MEDMDIETYKYINKCIKVVDEHGYNKYPELVSLLYDVGLLPEQIVDKLSALYMSAIVEAFMLGLWENKISSLKA